MSFAAAAAGDASLNAQYPILSNECLIKMQMDRFEVFKTQDAENGHFDVIFEIEGKKLYANKIFLTPVSQTLNSWLSDRWTTKDEPIKIESYTYDIFYQFLCFLYSGSCILSNENIFALVDVAEFFGVSYLKDLCENFLCNMEMTVKNVEKMFDVAVKYTLQSLLTSIKRNILNFTSDDIFYQMLKTENLFAYKKSFVKFLFTTFDVPEINKRFCGMENYLFEIVYKWAEYQIMKQKPVVDDENFDLDEAVRIELYTIISNPKFSLMTPKFLFDFVVEKGFILSPTELKEIYEAEISYHGNFFKSVYELAEKQALKKQMMAENHDENFNIANSFKADLAEVLPCVKFYEMGERFLMNFVVAKEILTAEQASHAHDILVEVSNNGKIITGVYKDDIGLRQALELMPCYARSSCTKEIRFLESKFFLPENPSTVFQTKEIQWYFCLDYSGILSLKHSSVIDENDYLLTEMKEKNGEFQLTPNEMTRLSAAFKSVLDS